MDIDGYLTTIRRLWTTGHATEHSYRPALQALFASIDPALEVINEPKRSEGGMPDFLFQRDAIAIGWAEAKDIDKDVIRVKGAQAGAYAQIASGVLETEAREVSGARRAIPVDLGTRRLGMDGCLGMQMRASRTTSEQIASLPGGRRT